MPRIPVRTTPYHTLPRCTRHYKSKRDLILRALGKASFINGSQYVVAWISPKGEVDYYASELLQPSATAKEGGVLNKKEFEREAARVKAEVNRRWEELRVLSERGQAPVMEEDEAEGEQPEEEEDAEEEDPDKTLVEDGPIDTTTSDLKKASVPVIQPPQQMMSTFVTSAKPVANPGPPMHPLTLSMDKIDEYYMSRFADLQQQCCKLVVKAWIKVIEPKKQMKYPYNKGEEAKPKWWPAGVRHREPDHLGKTERLILLSSIFRSAIAPIARLELSTAEAGAHIPPERLPILREIYLVGKEEERYRNEGSTASEIVVQLPCAPVPAPSDSPEAPTARRSFDQMDKENAMVAHQIHPPQKRLKPSHPHAAARLGPLVTNHPNYYDPGFAYSAQWRDPGHGASHLSPYPSEVGYSGGSDYGRSPNPDAAAAAEQQRAAAFAGHPNHLAPILNHSHAHTPHDSPAFSQTATLGPTHATHAPPAGPPSASSAFYARNAGQSIMQQQQMEFLQSHGHYDYGNPYIADHPWEGGFAQASS